MPQRKARRSGLSVRHPTLWRFLQLCPRAAWRSPLCGNRSRLQKALRFSPVRYSVWQTVSGARDGRRKAASSSGCNGASVTCSWPHRDEAKKALAVRAIKKGPAFRTGPDDQRFISTSTPGRRSLLISTSGSRTRRRSSIVTSGSRMPLPTVTSGERVQFSPHSGPTQVRSHTSAALAGSERRAELVNAAATART